jgi:ferric-dicitrate binding protein FerR (iron transport regulator)
MKENYLAKWLNDELSGEELRAFMNTPEFQTYQRIVRTASEFNAPDFDVEQALSEVRQARQKPKGRVIRLTSYQHLWKVAAALIILLGISFFYINSMDQAVQTDYAQRTEVFLPDASEVILNAGSELSFSEKKWDSERHVNLRGEAYFKVAKGQTFTVETSAGTVTVLGTQFNVLQRDGIFIVSCYEGLVRVEHQGTAHELPAGTGYRMVNSDMKVFEVLATRPSWTVDESTFLSMPLSFVLEEFQRQYDMEVDIRGVDTRELFTGTFSNTNLELALQSISAPLQLGYSLEGNKVLIYAQNAP